MPAIKSLCIVYIETIRGVPLISLLFMSSIMFPLFLPQGITINNILRAQVAIILFTAAYIAEVVRGGLQAIGRGQYEAAESLGLNYFQQMRLIILPQALKIVIPPTVGILISAFKDTSLVVIIGLFDLLKTTQVTLSDPRWMGFSIEAYIFIALIYFAGCFSMSNYSRRLAELIFFMADNLVHLLCGWSLTIRKGCRILRFEFTHREKMIFPMGNPVSRNGQRDIHER
jgi:general L-amino acid transport system permease protein